MTDERGKKAGLPAKGSSVLGRSGTANFGSTAPLFRYFLMVLRDRPVLRAQGQPANDIQKSHVDHSAVPRCSLRWGKVTWVNSQRKLCPYPGQFRVEINT